MSGLLVRFGLMSSLAFSKVTETSDGPALRSRIPTSFRGSSAVDSSAVFCLTASWYLARLYRRKSWESLESFCSTSASPGASLRLSRTKSEAIVRNFKKDWIDCDEFAECRSGAVRFNRRSGMYHAVSTTILAPFVSPRASAKDSAAAGTGATGRSALPWRYWDSACSHGYVSLQRGRTVRF